MTIRELLTKHSDLREAVAALAAQHIDAGRTRLDDLLDIDAIRQEQGRIAAWKEILKHAQQARHHEDKHGRGSGTNRG